MSIIEQIVKRGKLKKIKKMIDVEQLLKALNALDNKQTRRHGNEIWSLCPSPDHKDSSPSWSINVNPDSDRFGAHNCFSCGYRGNFLTLTKDKLSHSTGKEVSIEQASKFIIDLFTLDKIDEDSLYNLMLDEREQVLEVNEIEESTLSEKTLPKELEKISKGDAYYNYLTRPIQKYGRGLKPDLIDYYHIGCCNSGLYHDRIIIPFYQEGILVSFLARSILPPISTQKKNGEEFVICPECRKRNTYKMKECIKCDHDLTRYVVKKARARYPKGSTMELMLWPYDEVDINLDYVILVEGATDKLRLETLGYKNVLCLFGNKVSDHQVLLLRKLQDKMNKKLRIFLFPDADDGGDILIDFANAKLKYEFITFVVELPWNEESPLDPGSATASQIRAAFNKSEKLHKVHMKKFGGR